MTKTNKARCPRCHLLFNLDQDIERSEMEQEYPNVFKRWKREDLLRLRASVFCGTELLTLCELFGRPATSISKKIKELELDGAYATARKARPMNTEAVVYHPIVIPADCDGVWDTATTDTILLLYQALQTDPDDTAYQQGPPVYISKLGFTSPAYDMDKHAWVQATPEEIERWKSKMPKDLLG